MRFPNRLLMARVIQKIYFVERLLQHGYRLELSASGYRARFATISLRGDTRILPTARSVQAMLELPRTVAQRSAGSPRAAKRGSEVGTAGVVRSDTSDTCGWVGEGARNLIWRLTVVRGRRAGSYYALPGPSCLVGTKLSSFCGLAQEARRGWVRDASPTR